MLEAGSGMPAMLYTETESALACGSRLSGYRVYRMPCRERRKSRRFDLDRHRRRFPLAEIPLPLGIERQVGLTIVEPIKLNLLVAWPFDEGLVDGPGIGAGHREIPNLIGILPLGGFRRRELTDALRLRAVLRLSVRLDSRCPRYPRRRH